MGYMRKTAVPLALVYAGIILVVIRLFIKNTSYSEIYLELASLFGTALIVAGIVLYGAELSNRRLLSAIGEVEKSIGEAQSLRSRGIRQVEIISPSTLEGIIGRLSYSQLILVQFNLPTANRHVVELITALAERKSWQRTQLLIAGANSSTLEGLQEVAGLSFEARLLIELLDTMLRQNIDQTKLEVRWTAKMVSQTAILEGQDVSLLISHAPKGNDLLLLGLDPSAELANQYRREFDQVWGESGIYHLSN